MLCLKKFEKLIDDNVHKHLSCNICSCAVGKGVCDNSWPVSDNVRYFIELSQTGCKQREERRGKDSHVNKNTSSRIRSARLKPSLFWSRGPKNEIF